MIPIFKTGCAYGSAGYLSKRRHPLIKPDDQGQPPALTGLKRTDSCTLSFDLHTHSTAHVCAHTETNKQTGIKKNHTCLQKLKGLA